MDWYWAAVAFVLIFGTVVYLAYVLEKKRNERMKVWAETMGFTFSPKVEITFLESLSRFDLFSQGHSKKIKNLLERVDSKVEVSIFDYQYTTGGGKNSSTWRQSVIRFRSNGLHLPSFSLRPENIFHKIGSTFGYQDIDFEASPEFSSQYLLRGSDEGAIRKAFNPGVLSYYQTHKGLCTEGDGDQLVFYRAAKRVKPEDLQSFLEEGRSVYELFRSA